MAHTEYKTKQRSVIENVIKNESKHITVDGVMLKLKENGDNIGRTTVYRTLEKLSSEGKVRKYVNAGESACYQYISDNCQEHFHLKCSNCGKLIHIECKHIDELASHIEKEHNFTVNKLKTVLYGICEDCAKNEKN